MVLGLVIIAVLAIAGLVLLHRGLWPPREGNDPYCWHCNYNLTGLSRETCPECGCSIVEHRIVYGRRHRRPGRIVLGVLCMLPALLVVAGLVAQVDFYQHIPAGWVISDLQSSDTAIVKKASTELRRRMNVGSLSAGSVSDLVDTCLVEQARPGGTMTDPLLEEYGALLSDAYLQKGMSPKQAETFFEQLVMFDLEVRPQILSGEDLPYRVEDRQGRVSLPSSWWYWYGDAKVFVDGHQHTEQGWRSEGSLESGCGSGSTGTMVPSQPDDGGKGFDVGKHTLTVKLRYVVYSGGGLGSAQGGTLRSDKTITLSAPFEVLEVGSEEHLSKVRNPEFAPELRKCIQPRNLRYSSLCINPQDRSIQGSLDVRPPLPLDVAFDIIVRVGDTETKLGTLMRPRDCEPIGQGLYWEDADPQLTSVDIILRTNMEAARKAVDVFEVWDGELVYKDVPIAPKNAWPTSGTGIQTTQPQPTTTSVPTTATAPAGTP